MDKYEVLDSIGKGSFGVVSRIRRKSDNKVFVWKEINYGHMSDREKHQLVSEVNILREVKHPHIVQYIDRVIDKPNSRLYIIMEYCEGGDLSKLIKRCKLSNDFIAEDVIWKIFTQIMLALHCCHTRSSGKVLHRDLKPGNIFLDRHMNVKIGDFGLSRVMGENSVYVYTHVGTPYYMSPEQITDSKYNEQSDIWSAGCLLYEITSLVPPFQAKTHAELAHKIQKAAYDPLPNRYSRQLQEVIANMLNVNPTRRPTCEVLLTIPSVDIRIKEREAKDKLESIKKKDDELHARMEKCRKIQEILERREADLSKKESNTKNSRTSYRAQDTEEIMQRLKNWSNKENQPLEKQVDYSFDNIWKHYANKNVNTSEVKKVRSQSRERVTRRIRTHTPLVKVSK